MAENKVQVYKTTSCSSVWVLLHVYMVSHYKLAFDQREYMAKKEHICHQYNIVTTKKGHMTQEKPLWLFNKLGLN